jgi:hypothetical protein
MVFTAALHGADCLSYVGLVYYAMLLPNYAIQPRQSRYVATVLE